VFDGKTSYDDIYGVWFNPDNDNEVMVVNEEILRVIDVATGTNKETYRFYEYLDKYNAHDTNHDEHIIGHKVDGQDVYIITSKTILKFSFSDHSLVNYKNFFSFVEKSNPNAFDLSNGREIKDADLDDSLSKLILGGYDYDSLDKHAVLEIWDIDTQTRQFLVKVDKSYEYTWPRVAVSPNYDTFVTSVTKSYNDSDNDSDNNDDVAKQRFIDLYYRHDDVAKQKFIDVYYTSGSSYEENSSENTFYHNDYVTFVKYLNDDTLVSGDESGNIKIWDMTTETEIAEYNMHNNFGVCDFEFIDNIEDSKVEASLTNTGDDLTFTFPDSNIKKNTYTLYEDETDVTSDIDTVDLETGSVTFSTTHTGTMTADYVFENVSDADGNLVISCGGNMKVWEKKTKRLLLDYTSRRSLNMVAVSPNQNMVAFVGENGDFQIHDLGVNIVTHEATDRNDNSMTLRGEVLNMGGYSSLDCYFEYSDTSDFSSNVQTSAITTVTEEGKFNAEVTGLTEGTEYYFRAKAEKTV
jgi:hypothetical protein